MANYAESRTGSFSCAGTINKNLSFLRFLIGTLNFGGSIFINDFVASKDSFWAYLHRMKKHPRPVQRENHHHRRHR